MAVYSPRSPQLREPATLPAREPAPRREPARESAARNARLDALKGLAAMCVIVIHGIPRPWWIADSIGRPLHFGQAVPVFFVLLGMNGLRSLRRRQGPLFTRAYFQRQFDRIVVPV